MCYSIGHETLTYSVRLGPPFAYSILNLGATSYF